MPTLILFDNSLSMYKNIKSSKEPPLQNRQKQLENGVATTTNLTKKDLACRIVRKLVDHLTSHFSYEKIALVKS